MLRLALVVALAVTAGGCRPGSRPAGDDAGPGAVARPAEQRDALITLAALQAAAGLEATDDDRQRFLDMGLLDITAKPDRPLRAAVLSHVRKWSRPTRHRALAFLREHATYSTLYHAFVVESFGPPPAFTPRPRAPATQNNAPKLRAAQGELGDLLRMAWTEGEVASLARSLEHDWDALQFAPDFVAAKKQAVLTYLGFPNPESLPRFSVVFDP